MAPPRVSKRTRELDAQGAVVINVLTWEAAATDNTFALGHAAMLINEGLPSFIVETLRRDPRVDFATMPVGVLGMAFKADVDDVRDSLSFKLAKLLRFHGALVRCSDEFVQDDSFVSKEELLATCPIVIVAVPHSAYRRLGVPADTVLVDVWSVTERAAVPVALAS